MGYCRMVRWTKKDRAEYKDLPGTHWFLPQCWGGAIYGMDKCDCVELAREARRRKKYPPLSLV